VQDAGARGRRRRGSHGDDGADGDEADAVLVSEPGRRRRGGRAAEADGAAVRERARLIGAATVKSWLRHLWILP
jgi:hypothetical protein